MRPLPAAVAERQLDREHTTGNLCDLTATTSSRRMLPEVESGRDGAVGKRGFEAGRCLKIACTVTALTLAAAASCVLFFTVGVSKPGQDNWRAVLRETESLPQGTGLPRLMKQVGSDPRGKIAAHLTADPNKGRSKELIWQEDVGIAFSYGIEFSNNSLLIQQPGLYFIYTQVVFYARQCDGNTIFLSHDMHKLSPSYPVETILLKATKSVCHHHHYNDPWFKTSYQGAIFELEAGDRIFSRVSKQVVRYLDTKEGKTFFGVFAL
ncbi:lymphotoxin-alpha-like [Pristis pectinata]|uniref:lymphotoxin-alpha-like n=1 Tax=Pristis pectinata TaxID=685728 RepID=UPI00223DCAE0|nr:lymphotoxin-alpha-like [Pristis pectinata]